MQSIGPYWVGDTPLDPVMVSIVRDGQAVDLSRYDSAGAVLTDPNGAVVAGSSIDVGISENFVTVTWPQNQPVFSVGGFYILQIILKTAQSSETAALLVVDVRDPNPSNVTFLATPADVLKLSGRIVEPEDIERAQMIIETWTGVSVEDVTEADTKWYSRAVAYQAAWMTLHWDVLTRADMVSVNQDGQTATTRDRDSLIVAPNAKRSIAHCSFARRSASSIGRTVPVARTQFFYSRDPIVSDDTPGQIWNRL